MISQICRYAGTFTGAGWQGVAWSYCRLALITGTFTGAGWQGARQVKQFTGAFTGVMSLTGRSATATLGARTGAILRAMRCVMTCSLALWPGFAHAEAAWVLPEGSSMQHVARQASVYGAPAEMWSFEAPMDVAALIAFLSRQYPALRDMAVFPGMAVLSDDSGPCSRRVTLSGDGRHSKGTLSTICWDQTMRQPARPAAWLPAGARLAFEFAEPMDQAGYAQQIWQYESPPDDVAKQARSNLLKQGWRVQAGGAATWQTWLRGDEAVIVDVLGKDQGSVLAVLQFNARWLAPGVTP